MESNLFFEGPVRTGKSTALRRALLPYLSDLGGFVVQRLLDSDGIPTAYRLICMDEVRQTKEGAEELFLSVDAPYPKTDADAASNIFLWITPRRFDTNVFDSYGVECLRNVGKNKIILLDEVGGVDLLSSRFRTQVTSLLNGPDPCIGIIKELEKARDAQSFNREFRAFLNVQQISNEDLSRVPSLVNAFLLSQGF